MTSWLESIHLQENTLSLFFVCNDLLKDNKKTIYFFFFWQFIVFLEKFRDEKRFYSKKLLPKKPISLKREKGYFCPGQTSKIPQKKPIHLNARF